MPAIFSGFQAHSDFIDLYHFMLGYFKRSWLVSEGLRYTRFSSEAGEFHKKKSCTTAIYRTHGELSQVDFADRLKISLVNNCFVCWFQRLTGKITLMIVCKKLLLSVGNTFQSTGTHGNDLSVARIVGVYRISIRTRPKFLMSSIALWWDFVMSFFMRSIGLPFTTDYQPLMISLHVMLLKR